MYTKTLASPFVIFCSILTLSSTPSHAAVITGGMTDVLLTSADLLSSAGIAVSPISPGAILPPSPPSTSPTAEFPITGGSIGPGGAIIDHSGGLALSKGGDTVDLEDFTIDTGMGVLSGTVIADGTSLGVVPLFNLGTGATATTDIPLTLTSTAASALNSLFFPGVTPPPLSDMTVVGDASTYPTVAPAPEPSTWGMMALGFAGLGFAAWRRKAASAAAAC